ncbi:MAG: globin domain-containing protein, partial [Xenococcaceae cyanobacterium]
GILPEHYPLVGNAILTTFSYYLGSDWTPEVKKAWKDAYNLISSIMLEGVRDLDSNSVRETWSTTNKSTEKSVLAREKKNYPRKVSTSPNLPAQAVQNESGRKKDPDYAELPLNIELLERSFAQIRPRLSKFSASFYKNLFIIYPEIQPLFANTDMKAQEQKLVDSLILVILNLRQPELWTQALRDLGARHANYGTFAEHYPLVGNVLLTTFRQYLKSDWTPEVRQAWKDAYILISKIMLEGAEYSSSNVSNVIDDNWSTQSKLRKKPTVSQKKPNYRRKIHKNPNLSAQSNHNEFYENLLATILIVGSIIVILFMLL